MFEDVVGRVIAALIATGIVAFISTVISQKRIKKVKENLEKERNKIEIYDSENQNQRQYNIAFYKRFEKAIRSAGRNVYISGQGLEISTQKEKEIADSLFKAMRFALSNNGVHLVRIQTQRETDKSWLDMFANLLQEYPDKFEFYITKEDEAVQISSVAVIDAEDAEFCVVEVMLCVQQVKGTKICDVAGPAFFITGNQHLAIDMRNRLLSVANDPTICERITNPNDLRNLLQ